MRLFSGLVSVLLTVEVVVATVAFAALVGCRAFGFECYDILTNSMAPSMPAGTLVWVQTDADPSELEAGDVVAYRAATGAAVAHRVVSNDPGRGCLITRGDGNSVDDAPVSYQSVIGKTLFGLPVAGMLVSVFVSNKAAVIFVVIGANTLLLLIYEIARRQIRRRAGESDRKHARARGAGEDQERTERWKA